MPVTFQDIFKTSFLEKAAAVPLLDMAVALVLSFLLGLFVFFIYKQCYAGVMYSPSFGVTLVALSLITTLLILTVVSNIVLSLGMVGALSIVRYRTAVKSPLDLMFLFWAITTGIAAGARYYYIAWVAFLFVALVFAVLRGIRQRRETYMLILNYQTKEGLEEEIRRVLHNYKAKVRSKIVRGETTELTVEVLMRDDNLSLPNTLSALEGVNDVTLVQYRGSYEA